MQPRVAETIARETGTELLPLNGGHNVTAEEMKKGVTFISLLEQDLEQSEGGTSMPIEVVSTSEPQFQVRHEGRAERCLLFHGDGGLCRSRGAERVRQKHPCARSSSDSRSRTLVRFDSSAGLPPIRRLEEDRLSAARRQCLQPFLSRHGQGGSGARPGPEETERTTGTG